MALARDPARPRPVATPLHAPASRFLQKSGNIGPQGILARSGIGAGSGTTPTCGNPAACPRKQILAEIREYSACRGIFCRKQIRTKIRGYCATAALPQARADLVAKPGQGRHGTAGRPGPPQGLAPDGIEFDGPAGEEIDQA